MKHINLLLISLLVFTTLFSCSNNKVIGIYDLYVLEFKHLCEWNYKNMKIIDKTILSVSNKMHRAFH